MAVHNPTEHHQRAFKTGCSGTQGLEQEKGPYFKPSENTWQAIGYRHGLRIGTDDDHLITRAFDWSLTELRQHDQVDESLFRLT